jgi:hypothetical protein
MEKPERAVNLVDISELQKLLGESDLDYAANAYTQEGTPILQAQMHRLLAAGLVDKVTAPEVNPDLSGSYEDTAEFGFHPLRISVTPGTRAVSGDGTYVIYWFQGYASPSKCEIKAFGSFTPGILHITFSTPNGMLCAGVTGKQPWNRSGDYKIQQTGPTSITLTSADGDVMKGNTKGGTLTIPHFVYSLSRSFLKAIVATPNTQHTIVNSGQFKVTKVSQVLLGVTDTSADADFNWRIDFNEYGKALWGKDAFVGSGKAGFRKQPDGSWVCTSTSDVKMTGGE